MKKKKILIIEDETTLRKTLSEYLSDKNFEIVEASDGETGLKMAKSEKPDLIVLDIILPKINGFKVLDEIKKDEGTKNIPVILLTNLESTEDIQKAFESGAKMYLVKSAYSLEDIAKKISENLGK